MTSKTFASDNYAGIHPTILQAIINANTGHAQAYGADTYTQNAIDLFKQQFGSDIDVYFVCTGTAANVLSLSTILKPYHAIICSNLAHINVDECGAAEHYIGSKLCSLATPDGKLTVNAIEAHLGDIGDQHRIQPKVISITQSTELGTVYKPEEIKAITTFAHARNMYVHMDGARLSNAAASLNLPLKAITADLGIDIATFGGTKNGMMLGEAVIFFNKELSSDFKYIRKQGMQLVSKMRFISAQFTAMLSDDLWLRNAQHANAMAQYLAQSITSIPNLTITRPVEANAVFVRLHPTLIEPLQKHSYFYVWDSSTCEVRWMTSWDTQKEDIQDFVAHIQEIVP